MTDKLLPCPFCGGKVFTFSDEGKDYIRCNNSGCRVTATWPKEEPCAWNARKAESTHEFVDRLIRHQRLLKAKHWARSGWDGVPPEEVEEYKATYAAFTKVINYIKAWDERMNK